MFIDYITLLLVNMVAGFALLAGYVYRGLDNPDRKKWVPGFAMTGLIALVFGAHMTMTWPVVGPYNSAFGEMSVLFGVIFLGAALAIAMDWSLMTVAVYAFFAGVAAVVLGVRIIDLKLTKYHYLTGIGYILSGLGGIFAAPSLVHLGKHRSYCAVAAGLLAVVALIWAATAYPAYWAHMKAFSQWVPFTARGMSGR
jgi:putative membrane protein